jgi:hypothetical protein
MESLPTITNKQINTLKSKILGLSGNMSNARLRRVHVNTIIRDLRSFNQNNRVYALYNLLGAWDPSIQQTGKPYNNLLRASKPPNKQSRPLREVKIELIKKFLNVHNTTNKIESLIRFAKLNDNQQNLTNNSKQKILLIMSIYNAKNISTLNNLRKKTTNTTIINILEQRRFKNFVRQHI